MIADKNNFLIGAGMFLFGVVYLLVLTPLQVGPLTEEAALLPVVVSIVILGLSLVLMVSAWRISPEKERGSSHGEVGGRAPMLAAVIGIMFAYSWLLTYTGFLLTSSFALVTLFLVFGVRNWRRIIAISATTLALLYIAFEKLLGAPLPVGTLIERLLE